MKPSYGQQEFIETKNNLSLLKEDLDRQQMLAQENAASEKTLMTARTHYENTLARHASLREQLRLLGLDPGDPIAEMVDISRLNLHLVVYEKDIHRVGEGQEVEFTTEVREYHGTVHTSGKYIDEENRSVDVHAHIANPDAQLLSGMYVKARILTGRSNVWAIPETGEVIEGGQSYVFTREGNTFSKKAVQTGLRKDGFVEILLPGDLARQGYRNGRGLLP